MLDSCQENYEKVVYRNNSFLNGIEYITDWKNKQIKDIDFGH